jgi:hypothetical protein
MIIFSINKNDGLKIFYDKNAHFCYYPHTALTIKYVSNRASFIIGLVDIDEFVHKIRLFISQLLQGNKQLDESFNNNIGYIGNYYNASVFDNKHYIDNMIFKNDFFESIPYWIGENHTLCGYRHRQTWLYNDDFGNIILEVTPSYYSLNKRRQNKISFEKWMKKYKPILKRTISKEIAQQWLLQMEDLLAIINQNIARMQKSDAQ